MLSVMNDFTINFVDYVSMYAENNENFYPITDNGSMMNDLKMLYNRMLSGRWIFVS